MRALFALSLALLAMPVVAQTLGLARAAIERHGAVSLHNWHFDRIREEGGRRTRERCVGVDFRAARCRLMAVDDAPPDEAALAAYAAEHAQPVTADLPNLDLRDWIATDTLAIGERDAATLTVRFDAAAASSDARREAGYRTGVGVIDREDGAFVSMRTVNAEPFKPAFGVRIDTLTIDVAFHTVDDEVFASTVRMRARGRAFAFKVIDQETLVRFEAFARR